MQYLLNFILSTRWIFACNKGKNSCCFRFSAVFPNAFAPNHDGVNDVFRLKYPGHASDYNLQIFNCWGQKIFETSARWDGDFSGQHQPKEIMSGSFAIQIDQA